MTDWTPIMSPRPFGQRTAAPTFPRQLNPQAVEGPGSGETFQFTGTAGEYFRIWIVNLLLTILTLGIFSAWAKVRRLRYFYGNTWLEGHGFDYHADPVRILIGRLIVFGFLAVMNVLSHISPWFLVLLLPYLIALPWLMNQSLAFNARMTRYRNIRFAFEGDYMAALGRLVLMPIAAILSLGLLAPVASRMSSSYIGNRLRFGTAAFTTTPALGPLYSNLGVAIGLLLLVGAVLFAIDVAVFAFFIEPNLAKQTMSLNLGFANQLILVFSFFLIYKLYQAGVRNVVFNATTLDGGHRLSSTISRLHYGWILLSNLALTVCTLGLFWPWAAVRTWRYLAEQTAFHAADPLDGFVDQAGQPGSAAAAEYMDSGFDFGF